MVDLKILLEHAVHLYNTFERLAFSPSRYEQLSASPQEDSARENAKRVFELVLALAGYGRSSRVQGCLEPVALAPLLSTSVCKPSTDATAASFAKAVFRPSMAASDAQACPFLR